MGMIEWGSMGTRKPLVTDHNQNLYVHAAQAVKPGPNSVHASSLEKRSPEIACFYCTYPVVVWRNVVVMPVRFNVGPWNH